MNLSEMSYKILYHVKGYIRLELPSLRNLSWSFMFKNLKKSPFLPIPSGINHFHVNPVSGSMVILYDPDTIDIFEYLKKIASDPAVKKSLKDKYHEMPSSH